MLKFNNRLEHALKTRGKSPADLARAVKATESAVSQWLSGESKSMRAINLMATCQFLRCNPNWLASNRGPSGLGDATEVVLLEQAAWPFECVDASRWQALTERQKGRVEAAMNDMLEIIETERHKANSRSN